jgi:ligand-binding sensor domain-containing protein
LEDRKGNIWFGTIGAGVYRYDGKLFTNFTTKDGLVSDRVGCIYEDKAGNVWFGTEGGASRYDGKSFRNFTTKEGLPNNDINTIVEDNTGKFWFGTRSLSEKRAEPTGSRVGNGLIRLAPRWCLGNPKFARSRASPPSRW